MCPVLNLTAFCLTCNLLDSNLGLSRIKVVSNIHRPPSEKSASVSAGTISRDLTVVSLFHPAKEKRPSRRQPMQGFWDDGNSDRESLGLGTVELSQDDELLAFLRVQLDWRILKKVLPTPTKEPVDLVARVTWLALPFIMGFHNNLLRL